LFADLPWTALNPSAGRPREWRALTWSWAPIEGPISHNHGELGEIHAQVLEADCTATNGDPAVKPDSGHLTISGQLRPAQLLYHSHQRGLDRASLFALRIAGGVGQTVAAPAFYPDYDFAAPGEGHTPHGGTVYCLRLASIPTRELEISLVLRRRAHPAEHERIGLVHQEQHGSRDAAKTGGPGAYRTIHDSDQLDDAIAVLTARVLGRRTTAAEGAEGGGQVGNWYEGVLGGTVVRIV
jgi:hypothetical protein